MGPVITIQSKDVEKILDATADYYRQFNLELVELAIGNRQSKYMTLGKRYENWLSLLKAINYGSAFHLNDITTFIDLFVGAALGNEDWTIIEYRSFGARYSLDADDKLAEMLSKKLDTKVINYYEGEDYYSIISRDKGIVEDELDCEGNYINYASGVFKKYEKMDFDNISDFQTKVLYPYFDNLKLNLFDLHEKKINYDEHCRRFLLKGDPLSLQKYLKIEQMGTLDLNPLKGL